MCTLCQATATFDPARHETASAALSETADAAASVATLYTMQVGDTFRGNLSTIGDRDWVAVDLVAGQTYQISLTGVGSSALADPLLRIYSGNTEVAVNDDANGVLDSELEFTPTTTGTYHVAAGAFADEGTGIYQISVEAGAVTPPPPVPGEPGTLDEMALFLTDGYWSPRRSFDTSQDTEITVDLTALNAGGQTLARWAMEAWEMVADLQFTEITGGSADITFTDNRSGAFAGSSFWMNGDIIDAEVNVSASWVQRYGVSVDSYAMSTYVHEIGHALGLGHMGPYNGSASYSNDALFSNDSYQLSVMSYFAQDENPTVAASYAEPITAMMADIIAIQTLYGASDQTDGNTVWGEGSSFGTYLDQVFNGGPDVTGAPVALTIFDSGGQDQINLASTTLDTRIDLRPEQFSDVGGLTGNVGIARGTIIEDVILGTGDDMVTGNGMANMIVTDGGHDRVDGGLGWDAIWLGEGNDSAEGGGGNDRIGGDAGADQLSGGIGDDTIWGGTGGDQLGGGAGDDLVYGASGSDIILGDDGNDTVNAGQNNDTVNGGLGVDEISGQHGNDMLLGGGGNDRLDGGGGRDNLTGGGGNDLLEGGANNDTLTGSGGHDTLRGQNGDDTIWFAAGNDIATGGAGADTFVFTGGFGNDRVTDFDPVAEGDMLRLDDALWSGTLNAAQVIDSYGSFDGTTGLVLDFGAGARIVIAGDGLTAASVEAAIEIF